MVWSWTSSVGERENVVESGFLSLGGFADFKYLASPTTGQPESSMTEAFILRENSSVEAVAEGNERWLLFAGICASVDIRC